MPCLQQSRSILYPATLLALRKLSSRCLCLSCLRAHCCLAYAGDGKLGLLVAAVLVAKGGSDVTLLGRHAHKMDLVKGLSGKVVVQQDVSASQEGAGSTSEAQASTLTGTAEAVGQQLSGAFDACVEASGSSTGIRLALAITRPLGTIILKTTVSLKDPNMPGWSEIANDTVVSEKVGGVQTCASMSWQCDGCCTRCGWHRLCCLCRSWWAPGVGQLTWHLR
jgi:hypothetical protein